MKTSANQNAVCRFGWNHIGCLLFSLLVSVGVSQVPQAVPRSKGLNEGFTALLESVKPRRDMWGEPARQTSVEVRQELVRLRATLIQVLNDQDMTAFSRSMAAHYLGEFRFAEAAGSLATNIAMRFPFGEMFITIEFPIVDPRPAQLALIRIGSPAIAPLIQNIKLIEDAESRKLSIEALVVIDQNKDVTRLRLEQELATQTDAVKKGRLAGAIRDLETAELQRRSPWRKVLPKNPASP